MFRRILRATFDIEQVRRPLALILLLPKRDFSLFSFTEQQTGAENSLGVSVGKISQPGKEKNKIMAGVSDGLVLYYNQYSFYSQKVVMALHEKNLPFEPHSINLTGGEQFKYWFLQINPRGEVPVLQDTGKIIPDSARIIDYLEDNFSNGDTPRLIPMDQGAEIRQKVTYFRSIIDKLNGNVLTSGSILHPELATGKKKVPFIAPVRKQLVKSEKDGPENLRKLAEKYPEAKEVLLEKATNSEKKHALLQDKEEFLKILSQVDEILDQVETELKQHTDERAQWWLCSDRFTIADISLTILLERLNQIGMEPRFWTNGKRPHIEEYYRRVRERESYKQTVPTTLAFVKTIFITKAPLFLGMGVAALIAIIVGGYFVARKLMYK